MSKVCIKCGAQLDDNAVFCDDCGFRQDQQFMQEGTAEEQQVDKGEDQFSGIYSKATDTVVENSRKQAQKQSKIGIAAFVMGILSIATLGAFFTFDILGIIFGVIGLKRKNTKTSFAKIGLILSIVATVFVCIVMLIAVL